KQLGITNCELGSNQIIWDASKFASGIYFYKLVVDGKPVDTKKMILLK
ncbi:MAG: secretion protein Por, partial [Candidatus Cloacimonetes bacterium]|nr:secretion protein Por [Candidatus Cloacimonadota bacterium]